jgi:FAD/FMN-containing dehydrogenase
MITAKIIDEFNNRLPGRVLTQSHPEYDLRRKIHNGMIDRKPALIVRCRDTHDVAQTVRLARTYAIPVSIRGGGHNFAGKAVLQDGLMIDL